MAVTKAYDQSVFAKYFAHDDAAVLAWASNVLAKMVADGTVANYILREDQQGNVSDFNDLYEPVARFFAYFVQLARQFELFKSDTYLSNEYIQAHGGYSSGAETLTQLVYAVGNSLRIRSQRGSLKMIEVSTDVNVPDGELLRLVGWSALTFFKMGVARPQYNGWNLDHSGPGTRSCTGRYDLNLGYENTEDVVSLTPYPLIDNTKIFLSRYRGKNCLEIEGVTAGNYAGIGANDATKRITVDPRINYEITFSVAQDVTDENITFGIKAFDGSGNQVMLQSVADGAHTNYFFETRRLNKAGRFYFVRGILFNSLKDNVGAVDSHLNIGFGRNLRMNDNVKTIIPYIVYDNNTGDDSDTGQDNFSPSNISTAVNGPYASVGNEHYDGQASIYLWNIKVTPCALKYERCFLDNKNFIDIILDNKNGRYSNEEINSIFRKYFIPYGTAFKITHLNDLGDVNADVSLLLLEDGGYILLEDSNKIQLE